MKNKMSVKTFTVILLVIYPFPLAFGITYDRVKAAQYASDWWFTDSDGDGMCDHVNGRLAKPQGPYTFYYGINNDAKKIIINDGDNTIRSRYGYDCTNFVSQCLKAGGLEIEGDGGKGGTYTFVSSIEGYLEGISEMKFILKNHYNPSQVPDDLGIGDVILFYGRDKETGKPIEHSTFVISNSGANVKLAAHGCPVHSCEKK